MTVISDNSFAQTTRKRHEATFDEKMAALQHTRSNLTAKKGMIESQIRDLDARIEEKRQKGIGGGDKEKPHGGQ